MRYLSRRNCHFPQGLSELAPLTPIALSFKEFVIKKARVGLLHRARPPLREKYHRLRINIRIKAKIYLSTANIIQLIARNNFNVALDMRRSKTRFTDVWSERTPGADRGRTIIDSMYLQDLLWLSVTELSDVFIEVFPYLVILVFLLSLFKYKLLNMIALGSLS